jgi:hypothetical protein
MRGRALRNACKVVDDVGGHADLARSRTACAAAATEGDVAGNAGRRGVGKETQKHGEKIGLGKHRRERDAPRNARFGDSWRANLISDPTNGDSCHTLSSILL